METHVLPWIEKAKYLGNTVTNIPDGFTRDAKEKRAIYIEKNVEIMQEFSVAHPDVKCRINRIFNSSFPGSVLYNLSSDSVKHIVSSWSVSVKQMWGLPYQAHRYLVRELGGPHAEEMLITRYVKFLQSVRKSPKLAVQFMLEKTVNNVNTVTGSNARFIHEKLGHDCDIFSMKPAFLKKNVRFCEVRQEEKWRVNMIKEIVNVKQNVLNLKDDDDDFLTSEQLDDIIAFLSTS